MDIRVSRIISALLMGFLTFIAGLVPIKVNKALVSDNGQKSSALDYIIPVLNAFAGGILFSTYFIHMIPEIRQHSEALMEAGRLQRINFPFTELIVASGFFLVYFVEEIVHFFACYHSMHQHHGQSDRNILACTTDYACSDRESHTANNDVTKPLLNSSTNDSNFGSCGNSLAGSTILTDDNDYRHSIMSSVRSFILIFALSLHSLFEGIAVGVQESVAATFVLFGGVLCHKLVLAFCIGLELLVAKTKPRILILYMSTFSLMSPLGIVIAMFVGSAEQGSIVEVVLQGLSAGTLFYVTFFEVLKKERVTLKEGSKTYGMVTMFFVLVGFVIMSLFVLLEQNDKIEHSTSGYEP